LPPGTIGPVHATVATASQLTVGVTRPGPMSRWLTIARMD